MRDSGSCQVCGTALHDSSESCPVCALRGALKPESVLLSAGTAPPDSECRFEHYEVLKSDEGMPIELGRGSMGITYKAVDVRLQCPVALKIISAQLIGDDSARLRFLREARAAASVRHPNVASVFHLGTTGESYFYVMELVDGEPLDTILRRFGTLAVELALEIVAQVACGLSAIHKKNLVHRDIKPANIILSLEGDGAKAKIIDLGLAKAVSECQSDTAISIPGSFVGTPEFASPEQFAGIGVDIRSDLYSLGASLWNMVAGRPPFEGTAAELMHKHLRTTLPTAQLHNLQQPLVALLEVLLDKDPARRFQNPAELLKTIPTIKSAIETRHRISRRSLHKALSTGSRVGTRKPPARLAPKKISVARLPVTGSDVFGRDEDIAFLDRAWATKRVNVVTIVAWAGVGKSTLANHWLRRLAAKHYCSAELVFGWSFYRQGSSGGASSADEFLDAALTWFGDRDPRLGTAWEKGERLAKLVAHRRALLVLDGLEPLQNPPGPQEGRLREPSLQALLRELAALIRGCV
jgi:Protein kinase domain